MNLALQKLKKLITCSPCLAYFDVNKEVDASNTALCGSLLQPNGQGKLQPVAFTSCLMLPNEQRWAQIKKKALAIFAGCENGIYGYMGKGSQCILIISHFKLFLKDH